MVITLAHGQWSCSVDPVAGGALLSLFHGDTPILRPTPVGAEHSFSYACFPLVPYANRIANGCWPGGPGSALPPNVDGQPHPLHGVGWLKPWRVTAHQPNSARLCINHVGDHSWPYSFLAEQRLRLTDTGIAINLMITNTDRTRRPAGLGLHPYIRRQAETRVQFTADLLMENDSACVPTGTILPPSTFGDFAQGATLDMPLIDHCFAGWRQTATVSDTVGTIILRARGAPFLHLYAPPDADVLCLEPVSHGPDALNRAPQEMRWLQPGESTAIAMHIGKR